MARHLEPYHEHLLLFQWKETGTSIRKKIFKFERRLPQLHQHFTDRNIHLLYIETFMTLTITVHCHQELDNEVYLVQAW